MKMKYLIFLLATAILWNSGSTNAGCTPSMYQQTFSRTKLTIPVESLSIGPTLGIRSHWMITGTHLNDHSYVCQQSEDGFEIERFKDTLDNVPRLNYLDITGISSTFKPKVKCDRGHTTAEKPQEYTFYYLGQYKGTWHLQDRYSFKDPHFFLYVEQHPYAPKGHQQWYLGATGKYYPCLEEGLTTDNARAVSTSQGTKIDVLQNIQFQPSWIHKYMSRSGEWDGANRVTREVEKVLTMPADNYHYTMQLNEKRDSTKSLTLISNNPSTIGDIERIKVVSSFEISEDYWIAKLVAGQDSWRKLVNYGFARFARYFGLTRSGEELKEPILKGVDKISTLTMSVLHGDKRGRTFHDAFEKYTIRAEGGQFSNDVNKISSELLRGLKFSFNSEGHRLQKSSLNIKTTTCHPSDGQLKDKLTTLWRRMLKATPDKGETKKYYEETKPAISSETIRCPANKFRLLALKFTDPQEVLGSYFTTVSWIENSDGKDTRYDCKAYLPLESFVRFLKQDFVAADEEQEGILS